MSEENKKSGCCKGLSEESCCKSFKDASNGCGTGSCGTEKKADHGCGSDKKAGCGCGGPKPSK